MVDFKKYKKIHIVGIKGVGTAALSELLARNGYQVFGSDVSEDFATTKDTLLRLKINISNFSDTDLKGIDAVVRSVAYNEKNNEVVKNAKKLNLPVFTYPEVVSYFFNSSFGVAVAGSHGKTTTTAMLANALKKSQKNVSAIVGSKVNQWKSGALAGDLKKDDALFVLEADEYKRAFLRYQPKGAIITSVDYDHPDCYKTKKEYQDAFLEFARKIPKDGFLILNGNYRFLKKAAQKVKCKVVFYDKNNLINFKLKLPGLYSQENANAAYLACLELGISEKNAKKYIEDFSGTARRFEILFKKDGLVVIDDYAHHPSEIKATILGAKGMFCDKKVVAIFQPHTYSRTKKFKKEFADALSLADEVVLTDVYSSAREKKDQNFNLDNVFENIKSKKIFLKEKKDIPKYCQKYKKENVVLLFMGAGDINLTAYQFLKDM